MPTTEEQEWGMRVEFYLHQPFVLWWPLQLGDRPTAHQLKQPHSKDSLGATLGTPHSIRYTAERRTASSLFIWLGGVRLHF